MRRSGGGRAAQTRNVAILSGLALAAVACGPSQRAPETPTPESRQLLAEAQALESDGRAPEALRIYETVLDEQPRLAGARVRAADLARRTGDPGTAARHARRALTHPPEDAADLAALARALAPSDPDRAERALGPLLSADPARADVELAAAEIALARNDPSEAMRHLRRALAAGPSSTERLDVARGFSRAGFHNDAVETVRGAMEAGDTSPEARYTLGWALERAERYDECVREYVALLEDHPDYLPAYRNLGALMARDGELTRAVALWERGLRYHPEDPGLRANIDQALKALGLTREEGTR